MKLSQTKGSVVDQLRLIPSKRDKTQVSIKLIDDFSVLTIDGFYADADYVRELAISLTYSSRRNFFRAFKLPFRSTCSRFLMLSSDIFPPTPPSLLT